MLKKETNILVIKLLKKKKINHNKSFSTNSKPQFNKICLILSEVESSNLPLTSLIILTNLPLNLLTILFPLAICLLSSKDLLPNQYLKYH